MGRPKKVISDEERRARALERKQAQRERARQQTIRTALSQADQVQILSFPGSALPEPSTSIPEIPSVNVGLIDAVHNDTSSNSIARNEREAAGKQDPGPSTPATLDQATSDTGPRYRLRLRSSKSPTPTLSRGAEALQTDRSDAQSGRVAAEEAGQSQALQSHFTLPMRSQRCMPPTVTEPASIDCTTEAANEPAAASSIPRCRNHQENTWAAEHSALVDQSDRIPVVSSRGAVKPAESRPVELPRAAAPACDTNTDTDNADVGDVGGETVTLTQSVIYVTSPSPSSSPSSASFSSASSAPSPPGRRIIDRGTDADDDSASVSSFDVDLNNDSRRGHKRQSPGDASRTTRSRSATGNGPGDDEAVAGASHDVEPPSFRDIVGNNGAGRTSTQTAGAHSTGATRSLDNAIRAITSGETPAGLAFIEAQAATYRKIFERAFPLVCPCR